MNRVVSRWIVVTSNGGSGSSRPGNHARGSWSFPACLGAHYCPTESRGMTLDPHREQRNRNREHRLLRTLNGDSSVVHPSSIEALCAFHALLSRTCIFVARSNISREADFHLSLVIIIIIVIIITIIVTLNWFTTSERPANELIAPPEGRGSRNDLPSLTLSVFSSFEKFTLRELPSRKRTSTEKRGRRGVCFVSGHDRFRNRSRLSKDRIWRKDIPGTRLEILI